MTLTFGSLFAGIGGMDLGLERAGMRCVWQVEIDPYCRRVLAKHWSDVRRWDDVRTFPPEPVNEWGCNLICGGFPCQDISNAGKRAGIEGERSGLWSEFTRIIGVVRPRFVLVENVAALLGRGMGRVLGDLAALGFDAEWDCVPAVAVGAPHIRDRVFLLAYATSERHLYGEPAGSQEPAGWRNELGTGGSLLSNPESQSLALGGSLRRNIRKEQPVAERGDCSSLSDPTSRFAGQRWREQFAAYCEGARDLYWPQAEPPVCGVADGVPARVDRIRGLGNAVVPQVAEWIGRRILALLAGKESS